MNYQSRAEIWALFYAAFASRPESLVIGFHAERADAMLAEFDKRWKLREYTREFPPEGWEERPQNAKP